MTDTVCPPLGTGSVDFNALNDAAAAGEDLTEALEAATTRVEPLTEEEFAELPSLTGKTKAELLAIAADEGATADDTMTNRAISDAIVMHRAAAPVVDDQGALINPPASVLGDEPSTIGDEPADGTGDDAGEPA